MTDSIRNEYATKDLYFAAFLQVKGQVIKKLEQYGRGPKGQNPTYFIFKNREKCEELEDIFWSGAGDKIMVNAKDYFTTVRNLKSRIFSVHRLLDEAD